MSEKKYTTFSAFYPYYLSEHSHPVCRRLHYVGSTAVLLVLFGALISQQWWMLLLLPVVGYGPAWIGHFIFEKNKPATFTYPFYSFCADWVMLKDAIMGLFKPAKAQKSSNRS